MASKTVIEAVIVILVIIVIVAFIIPRGWPLVKSILNMNPEQETIFNTPESISNESSKFFSDYEKCFSSTKDKCLCNINIMTFPERYILIYEKTRLDFSRVKKEYATRFTWDHVVATYNEIKNAKLSLWNSGFIESGATIGSSYKNFNGKNVNCYVGYNKNINIKNLDAASYLLLDHISGIVITEKSYLNLLDATTTHDFINKKPTFYKEGNNICFVLEDKLSKDGIAYVNTLKQC